MLLEKEVAFERVVGMVWMLEDDVFTFSATVLAKSA